MVKYQGFGVGRRKCAVARVFLRDGTGKISVNGKSLVAYFALNELSALVRQPLQITNSENRCDILITVSGGGPTGQAGACRHGIAQALNQLDPQNHVSLRKNGFLTRDPRMVERKKYGQRGARRRFQFSKR